ncbi:unnamed protein product [Rotaria sp. Silwood1]|nr:unnamed protein product [Rotaria sp. Silwood1]
MLNHYSGTSPDGSLRRDRFNYLLDLYDPTHLDYITRERGQQVFDYLNKYNNLSNLNKIKPDDISSKTLNNNFEDHWNKVDIDGTERVSIDKFVDYISKSNDYKHYFDQKRILI